MPAPVQITAEQLLREAKERELELVQPVLWNAFHISVLMRNQPIDFFTKLGKKLFLLSLVKASGGK